jgi:hypothetical protein
MRFGSRGWIKLALIGAVTLGLSGCVAYPADPYYGWGYGPAYYAPPVTGSIFIGGGWGRGWGGWHGGWGGRHWR